MGNSERGLVRRGHYDDSEDSEDDSESSEDEEFEQYLAELATRDREEALVQSAMHRIERAKAKGRTDVDLNDEEMAALERRRKRDEAAKKKKSSKKRKDSRVAVPLTQLEPSSRKKKDSVSSQSRQQSRSNSNLAEDQDRHSRSSLGSFPPPAIAGRPRSGHPLVDSLPTVQLLFAEAGTQAKLPRTLSSSKFQGPSVALDPERALAQSMITVQVRATTVRRSPREGKIRSRRLPVMTLAVVLKLLSKNHLLSLPSPSLSGETLPDLLLRPLHPSESRQQQHPVDAGRNKEL
jgi:hypothetical protein